MFANGPHDYVADVLTRLLTPASVVLDVGANVGLVTLPVAARLSRGTGLVIAVEPVPANAARLQQVVALNGLQSHVRVLAVALGDEPGWVTLHVDPEAPTGNAAMRGAPARARAMQVPAVRLDDLRTAGDLPPIDLVKLDVEGAEVRVLRGAAAVLAADRPVLLGEFHRGLMPAFGHTMADAAALLTPLGYRFYAFRADLEVEQVDPRPGVGDLLCVPEDRVTDTLQRLATT
jgi:FkbM family methyltransferase